MNDAGISFERRLIGTMAHSDFVEAIAERLKEEGYTILDKGI